MKEYNCESINGFYRTGMNLCGRPTRMISCLWQWNGAPGCAYLANSHNPNFGTVGCR